MDGLGYLWVSNYGHNRTGAPRVTYDRDGGNGHSGWRYPLGDRRPDILQFGSNGIVAGKHPVDVNAFRGSLDELAAIFNPPTSSKEDSVNAEQAARLEGKLDDLLKLGRNIYFQLTGENDRGLPQSGNRTAYDLQAAIAEKVGVPDTFDKMAVLKAKKEV